MGLNEQEDAALRGFIKFHVMNPDARPMSVVMMEETVERMINNDLDTPGSYHYKLPEVVPLSEFDAYRPLGIYRYFAEEFGAQLRTNIYKKGLQEGDIFSLNITFSAKGDHTKRTVKKTIMCLVMSRVVSQEFVDKNAHLHCSICKSPNSRLALVVVAANK